MVALLALSASAATKSQQVHCFIHGNNVNLVSSGTDAGDFDTTTMPNYATLANQVTDTGSNDVASQGWNFDETTEQQIQCAFIVPVDYDSTSNTPPMLRLMGWGVTNDPCALDPGDVTVVMGARSREFASGDLASQAWGTEDTGSMTLPCESNACSGLDCNRADIVRSILVDATPNASDWTADNLVLVQIRRKTASDDYGYDFHLSSIRLQYPSN